MSDLPHSEERYPLLFLFLEDGQKSSRKSRGVFFERTRSQGIMSGATAVFTQWPNQLSSCGFTMMVLVITIVLLFLLILAQSMKPVTLMLPPKCVKKNFDSTNTKLYLVHNEDDWQQNQLEELEDIAKKYNMCSIELTVFKAEDNGNNSSIKFESVHEQIEPETSKYLTIEPSIITSSTITPLTFRPSTVTPPMDSPKRKKRHLKTNPMNQRTLRQQQKIFAESPGETIDLDINIGASKLLKAFLAHRRLPHYVKNTTKITTTTTTTTTDPPILTLRDLLARFPAISVRNVTRNSFFRETPLYEAWKHLNNTTLIFAARILKLWENGGISFELPENARVVSTNSSNVTTVEIARTLSPFDENRIIRSMIDMGYTSFEVLPEGLVTVDEEGAHMESKTTCHAFFGEALLQLKRATNKTAVPEVIRNTLKTFCDRGAVDSDYCNSIKTMQ